MRQSRRATNKAKLYARAESALRGLYHNATPSYPPPNRRDESGDEFQAWFEGEAESEIDYLGSGGAYGSDYRVTLAAPCNAGKYKSEAARRYYVAKGLRDQASDSQPWERITDYGKLYQWGRGGRTLAPDNLIQGRGGSGFSIKADYATELPAAAVVELIHVVESFNRAVTGWCAGVPEMWREHCEEEDQEQARVKQARSRAKAKETRERNYWAARDEMTAEGV